MPSAKSIAVAVTALAASGVQAGACKPTSTTVLSTTTESATSTTSSACVETETIEEYVLKDDNPPERSCGVKGQYAQEALPPGPASSIGDCAQSCIEGIEGDPWDCSLIAYYVEDQLAPDVYTCERYGGGFSGDEDGAKEFYVNECFERRTVNVRGRGGCARGRGGGRRMRRR